MRKSIMVALYLSEALMMMADNREKKTLHGGFRKRGMGGKV